MSRPMSKPTTNGATGPTFDGRTTPSERTLTLIEQRDALNERIAAEQARDKAVDELRAYIVARPALGWRDLLRIAQEMKPTRGRRSVKSDAKVGYKPPLGKVVGKVGRALNDFRKAHDLSKHQLGVRVKLSDHSIAGYESGRNKPSAAVVKRLAQVLGKPEGFFT
jgi:DNA-binding XRE family transcriptional regulator